MRNDEVMMIILMTKNISFMIDHYSMTISAD
jgi:hypothetical protein